MSLLSSPPPLTSQTTANIASHHRSVSTPPFSDRFSRLPRGTGLRCRCYFPARKNLDHIPKQFREENLPDGLMDNYKNVPEWLYGLPRHQMNMFMAKDNILTRQSAKFTPESITADAFYKRFSNIRSLEEEIGQNTKERVSMSRGVSYPENLPPDLESQLLDARIVFLGMALYEEVSELIIAQLLYLDYVDSSKPIYLYINSTGILDSQLEVAGFESLGFAIADIIRDCKAKVHTLNIGVAYGQAALILSCGDKGNRVLYPHSSTSLHLPNLYKTIGPTTDVWRKVRDLEAEADAYLRELSEVTGKPKEVIAKDARHVRYFNAEEAIEYGLADRVIHSMSDGSDKQNALERNKRIAMLKTKAAQAVRSGPGAVAPGLG